MCAWSREDVPALDGTVAVLTGANSGIGFAATEVLAERGATVVMACRSVDRGEDAAAEIRETVPGADLDVRRCDLADLADVERFAGMIAEDYDGVDLLSNNAGVMAIPRSETADGFEEQFGVNHLGHFALTGHLLPSLREAEGEARVVTQSSGVHERGDVDFEDLQHEEAYDAWGAYARSKLANVCFAYELDRRLDAAGIADVTSVSCHPGYAATDLQYRGPRRMGSRVRMALMRVTNAVFAQSPEAGALPMLYAATGEDVQGGEYVGPGGFMNMRGAPEIQRSSERSYDADLADRLWAVSEDLTGLDYELPD